MSITNFKREARFIWLTSDLVVDTIVDGNMYPLLTPTPIALLTQSRKVPEYVTVKLESFSTIKIKCVSDLQTLDQIDGNFNLYVTLHFRKIINV